MKLLLFLCIILAVFIQKINGAMVDFPWNWKNIQIPILPEKNGKILGTAFGKREAAPINNQEDIKQSITDGVIVDPDKAIIDGSAGLLKIVKRNIKINQWKELNHKPLHHRLN